MRGVEAERVGRLEGTTHGGMRSGVRANVARNRSTASPARSAAAIAAKRRGDISPKLVIRPDGFDRDTGANGGNGEWGEAGNEQR